MDDDDDDYEEPQGARAKRGTQGPLKSAAKRGNTGGGGSSGGGGGSGSDSAGGGGSSGSDTGYWSASKAPLEEGTWSSRDGCPPLEAPRPHQVVSMPGAAHADGIAAAAQERRARADAQRLRAGTSLGTERAAHDPERARWERFREFERREREEEARAAGGGNGGGLPGRANDDAFDDGDDSNIGGDGSVTSLSDDDGGDARMGRGGRHAGGAPRRAGWVTADDIAEDVTSADRLANALENWTATGQTPTGLTPDENRTFNKMVKLGRSERPAMEMTLAARNAIPGALTQLAGRDADLAPMGVPSGVCKLLERAAAVLATQHRYPPRAQLAMWINGLTSKTSGFDPATFQTFEDDGASSGVSQRQKDVWADAKDAAGKSCKTMVRRS